MKNLYEKFHNLFSVSKTLRFELKPIGKTQEYVQERILADDEYKAKLFKDVKKYADEYHKVFIEECLKDVNTDCFEQLLNEYYILYLKKDRTDKEEKEFDTIQQNLRTEISIKFTKNPQYKGLLGKELIKNYLKDYYKDNEKILLDVEVFNDFTTYFTGYNDTRENMYVKDAKHTAISYRLINENLPTFIKNMQAFEQILKEIPDIKEKIQNNLGINIDNYFSNISDYGKVLTQSQIEEYNLLIAGKLLENAPKIQGINELVNIHNQKNQTRLPKLKELYKQILSDTNSASFKLDILQDDKDIIDSINKYYEYFKREILDKEEFFNTISNICEFDLDKIYVNRDTSLTNLANNVYGDWNYINWLLDEEYVATYQGRAVRGTEKYSKQKDETLKKIKQISFAKIEELISFYDNESDNVGKLTKYFANSFIEYKKEIENKYANVVDILNDEYEEGSKELIKDANAIDKIKGLLDSIKFVQELVKCLIVKDKTLELDNVFYNSLNYELLSEVIPLYNKVRNYLTQKPYSTEKFKLNFNCPTLLDGWDLNKEEANLGTLFEKDGNYYLGIMDRNSRKSFINYDSKKYLNSNFYKKVEYKLLPGPNKMLPKVFFSDSRIEQFSPSEELLSKYELGCHKKGDVFDIGFCHELIDFYKQSIQKHEDWCNFGFNFSDTMTYEDISKFYREVEHQGYKITFTNISEEYINQLVDEGKLYLFQIYNKDFSEYSKGTPNLHTMYWKAIFDEDNLKDVVYKLNGGAEIFCRKQSLEAKITHPKNEPINNKNELNEKKQSTFKYDLIKDKRFTVDKFQFHVPITMNFKAIGLNKLNDFTKQEIKNTEDIHVIGIDRGERHLLYITVVNSKGEIVEQCSLNTITNEYKGNKYKTDYRELLDKKEKERNEARKSWGIIENIKELKEGYMSQVVHKLVELMFKYNAIVVLEDLNSGFKNSRKKVEKQVYDKFETKFISKLSYLVDKAVKDKFEEGGILNAYQLANTDLQNSKQNGVIFYIPAWNTSKIDPITGFVNFFDLKKVDNSFIEKFDDIRFNDKEQYFEFSVDCTKFSDKSYGKRKNWALCTYGERIRTFRNINKNSEWTNEEVCLTKEFKSLFDRYSIDYTNLKQEILNKADSKFYNANKEKDGFYGFASLFKLLVQLRNSITNSTEDYILSPVKNAQGKFFDSRKGSEFKLPENADSNGAYNIARKGLMFVERIKSSDEKLKIDYSITNADWLTYVQNQDK